MKREVAESTLAGIEEVWAGLTEISLVIDKIEDEQKRIAHTDRIYRCFSIVIFDLQAPIWQQHPELDPDREFLLQRRELRKRGEATPIPAGHQVTESPPEGGAIEKRIAMEIIRELGPLEASIDRLRVAASKVDNSDQMSVFLSGLEYLREHLRTEFEDPIFDQFPELGT